MEASRGGLVARVRPLDSVLGVCSYLRARSFAPSLQQVARRLSAFLSASPHVAVVDRLEYLAHVHCHHPESESPLSCFSLVLSEREVVDCLVTFSPKSCLIWLLELVEMRVESVGYHGGECLVAHEGVVVRLIGPGFSHLV